jgi:hypothetical protein
VVRLIRWLLGLCNHDPREVGRHWLLDERREKIGQLIEFRCTKCGHPSKWTLWS